MKRLPLFGIIAAAAFFCSCDNRPDDVIIDVDLASKGAGVSPSMYGIFFEEINHAGDGGLYGEMLMNRSFEERVLPKGYSVENGRLVPPAVINHMTGRPTQGGFKWGDDPYPGWKLIAENAQNASMGLSTLSPANQSAPTYMSVSIKGEDTVSLVNSGYWGLAPRKGEGYKLRIIARATDGYKGGLKARIADKDRVIAQKDITLAADGQWHDLREMLGADETSSEAMLYIDMVGSGRVDFDYVSLFPEKTYKERENGMRRDVAEFLVGMRPAFIRWPGGCIVEGITLSNRVEWKKTLGDPALRPGEYDTWGYRNTYGFGYKEFLDFCEDTGAQGMYVCNVGMGCQGRSGDVCTDKEAEFYLADALDAIEYAIGDTTTTWGAVRAAEGHPAPYPLQYVEIGNENWGPVYDSRFDMFYKAIKAKYPQLTLISNHGLGDGVKNVEKTDMIDPHWYVNPEFFFNNAELFDHQPRDGYTVYVGEYACNQGVGGGNMLAALSEAAFITGMERNSDLVTMTSYAPLFENRNDREWPTNLIWMDNDQVLGRSSYYVQKMFAENMPTYNVPTTLTMAPEPKQPITEPGYIGLGSWNTKVEYKDLKVTAADGVVVSADMSDPAQWKTLSGVWQSKDGVYSQTGDQRLTSLIWNKDRFGDCTIELKARKTGGAEGFFVYFGLQDMDLSEGNSINIAGWGNTATAFEDITDGSTRTVSSRVPEKIETGKWYDIKIVVSQMQAEYFLDGKSVMKYESQPEKRLFAVSGIEEGKNQVIVKVVNAKDAEVKARINFNGAKVEPTGQVITLSADSPLDENSFEEPAKISPKVKDVAGVSKSFTYDLEPNSFTIFRFYKR